MPRKTDSRTAGPAGAESRARRPSRQVPRPSAVVPVGVEAPARPAPERAPAPATSTPPRTAYAVPRATRPARASSLPAITDYGYVFADLRRIGILAGAAFLVLIGLTFVVH
jgi:hypothetical protein